MGLDVSHNAFSGAYSAFNRFRQELARAHGGSYPPHDKPGLDEQLFYFAEDADRNTNPGLFIFFSHSDSDGEISPEDCKLVADELEALIPKLNSSNDRGHITRAGGIVEVTKSFIAGCRAAHEANEPLKFW